MVRTQATEDATLDIPKGSIGHGHGHGKAPCGNPPPTPPPCPPISIEQLLATHNDFISVLVQNEARHGVEHPQHHQH
jgi:hypothetical protein